MLTLKDKKWLFSLAFYIVIALKGDGTFFGSLKERMLGE
jgi:hypothetical protein